MSKIRMALDNWSYDDFVKFRQASVDGDTRTTYRLAERLIVSWDFAVSLDKEDPLLDLPLEDSAEVLRTVQNALTDYAENIETDHVKVDFSKWNTRRFLEFNDDLSNSRTKKVEKALHEICNHPDVLSSNKPLTFREGIEMVGAVRKAYSKLISGKN